MFVKCSRLNPLKSTLMCNMHTRTYTRGFHMPGALLTEGELNMLPYEQTYSKVNGVWNLRSEEVC